MQQCRPACNTGLQARVTHVAGYLAMPPFPSPDLSGHFSTRQPRAIFCAIIRECLSWTALYSNACRGHRRAAIPDGMRRPCPARHGRRTLQPAGCTGPAQDEDVRTDRCRTVPQGRTDLRPGPDAPAGRTAFPDPPRPGHSGNASRRGAHRARPETPVSRPGAAGSERRDSACACTPPSLVTRPVARTPHPPARRHVPPGSPPPSARWP